PLLNILFHYQFPFLPRRRDARLFIRVPTRLVNLSHGLRHLEPTTSASRDDDIDTPERVLGVELRDVEHAVPVLTSARDVDGQPEGVLVRLQLGLVVRVGSPVRVNPESSVLRGVQPGLSDHAPRNFGEVPRLRSRNRVDRKSTRLNSSHVKISYAVFCLNKIKLRKR